MGCGASNVNILPLEEIDGPLGNAEIAKKLSEMLAVPEQALKEALPGLNRCYAKRMPGRRIYKPLDLWTLTAFVEFGGAGIRSNAVNADRIKSGLLTQSMVESRAKARGVSADDYMRGNLLGREVDAMDVAQAFVDLALAKSTTGAVITVDGGNIAAALR